jgi:hypothetical protein
MILNLLMFFGAFMVATTTSGRLLAAAAIGIVKGVIYFMAFGNIWLGALIGLVFFSLILGIIGCLSYLDRPMVAIPVYPRSWEKNTRPFQWVYVSLSALVFTVLFGEITFQMFFA